MSGPVSAAPAWRSAVDLFRFLDSGRPLRPVPSALRFGDDQIFADMTLTYARYYAMDVQAEQRSVSAYGGLLFVGTALAANSMRNASNRRKAEAMSAPQWREHCAARVVLTDTRTMCLVQGNWLQFPYHVVAELNADLPNAAVVTTFHDVEPMLLTGPAAAYYAVMAAYLMYGRERFGGLPTLAAIAADARSGAPQMPGGAPRALDSGAVLDAEVLD